MLNMFVCMSFQTDCVCRCLIRAFGENNEDGFLMEMKDMFHVLGHFLTVDSDVIMPTQVRHNTVTV